VCEDTNVFVFANFWGYRFSGISTTHW